MQMFTICLVVFTSLLGYGIIFPIFPFYAERVGASPEIITLTIAAYTVGQLLGAPVSGRLSDAYGRRPVLIVTLLGGALAYVVLAYADQLWWLAPVVSLQGLAGNIALAMTYASDISTEKNRARAVGMVGAALGVGITIGPGVGGLLAGNEVATANLFLPAMVSAVISFIAMLFAVFVLPESLSPENKRPLFQQASAENQSSMSLRAYMQRKALVSFSIASCCYFLAMTVAQSILPLWAASVLDLGPSAIGGIFLLMGVSTAVIQAGLIGRICDRFGEFNVALAGAVVLGVGLLGIAVSNGMLLLSVSMLVIGGGTGLMGATLTAMASKEAAADERGAILGIFNAFGGVGRVIGPAIAGFLYVGVSPAAPYIAGVLALVLAIIVLWVRVPKDQ